MSHLTRTHGFPLSADDLLRLQHDYRAFFLYGPAIQYSSNKNGGRRGTEPTYADLMAATDGGGELRAFLASEESFLFLKQLETDNLVVPLIGNFVGPKAIRAVGDYLRAAERDGVGVLCVERRAVPDAGRHLAALLRQRRRAAARRHQHLHPLDSRSDPELSVRADFRARSHAG